MTLLKIVQLPTTTINTYTTHALKVYVYKNLNKAIQQYNNTN